MKVKICDALCGSGKTTACINMINEHADARYMFVTQYLLEAKRIVDACPTRRFFSPESKEVKKGTDILRLITAGENIATTHALFSDFTDEVKGKIKEVGYTLILDEEVATLRDVEINRQDIKMLQSAGAIDVEQDEITWIDKQYRGRAFAEVKKLSKMNSIVQFDQDVYYWSLPQDIFNIFEDAYVLTYLFEYQNLKSYMDIYDVEYELIGVRQEGGTYRFCDFSEMDRKRDLRHLVHIVGHKKCNSIGDGRCALSVGWFETDEKEHYGENTDRLRKNILNIFRNVFKADASDIIWTCFKDYYPTLKSRGFSTCFTPFNLRATNEYADRHYLAYALNVFARPAHIRYFQSKGCKLDGDMQALSILVQWIFRSALRNGEEIHIYIPSVRMRYLLTEWLKNLAAGEDLKPIAYKTPRKPAKKTKTDKE